MILFLRLFETTRTRKVDTKNKMNNLRFVDDETIPLVPEKDFGN